MLILGFLNVWTPIQMLLLKITRGQKFDLIRTHCQWHSCETYVWKPFEIQHLTPRICFGSSHFRSSIWSIPLLSLDEVFHHLNRKALLRPSQLRLCTPPFWKKDWRMIERTKCVIWMLDDLFRRLKFSSNIPSNTVQHDKKMLDINVGSV